MGVQFIGGPERIDRDDADPNYMAPPLMGFGWKSESEVEDETPDSDQVTRLDRRPSRERGAGT